MKREVKEVVALCSLKSGLLSTPDVLGGLDIIYRVVTHGQSCNVRRSRDTVGLNRSSTIEGIVPLSLSGYLSPFQFSFCRSRRLCV